jgi:plasmid replication initiation protein
MEVFMIEKSKIVEFNFKNLDKNYIVIKSNNLNEAKLDKNITFPEYRILLIALSKISPLKNKLHFAKFSVNDFCNILNLQKSGMYYYVKKSCKKLATRIIRFEISENKGRVLPLFSEIKYDESVITIYFNEKLEKEIINLKKEYTKYVLSNILKLDTIHDIRLYELLKQYEKIKYRKFSIESLAENLLLKKSYKNKMSNLRELLKKSKNKINIHTDILIDFEEIKEGRKVVAIKFYLQSKNNSNDYELARKDIIVLRIQNLIHRKTGYILNAHYINNIHRKILLDLLENLEKNTYNNVLIRKPENFFLAEINRIQEMYNMQLLEKKIKDF